MHRMFAHAEATGQKEHDRVICWGWWQPSPKWDLGVETSAMEHIRPGMTRDEIRKVYNEVYQLKRVPSMNPCDVEMAENIWQEILNSVKEHLWHRWECAQLEEESGQGATSASRPDPWSKFQQRVHATYDHFWDLTEGSCKQVLAVHSDAHRWVLAAMAFLEDKIERLSHSISHGHQWLGSHRQSWSHQWRISRAADQCSREPPTSSHCGEHASRRAQSPSPLHSRWQVTFEDSPSVGADNSRLLSWADKMVWGDHSDWSQPKPEDLECLPTLDLQVQEFLSGEEMPWAGEEHKNDSDQSAMPEPSLEDSNKWVLGVPAG